MQSLNLSPQDADIDPTINLHNSTSGFNPHENRNVNGNAQIDPESDLPNLYPQLEPLNQEIKHPKISNEHMEPLDWVSGRRPNRPFKSINSEWLSILHSLSPRSLPAPPPPPNPPPARRSRPVKQYPTAYYLEQAPFYSQVPGPDPFYTPPSLVRSGLLKVFVQALLSFFFSASAPLLSAVKQLGMGLLAALSWLSWVLVFPVKVVVGVMEEVEWRWDAVLAVALAAQLIRLLPCVSVGVHGGMEEEGCGGPVYTIFIAGGEAIGNGAVIRSGST